MVKQFAAWCFNRIIVMIAAISLLIYGALYTNTGLVVLSKLVLPLVPGHLHFQKLNGHLLSDITFVGMKYRYGKFKFQIKEGELKWQGKRITNGIYIDALFASQIDLTLPKENDATPQKRTKVGQDDEALLQKWVNEFKQYHHWLTSLHLKNLQLTDFKLHQTEHDLKIDQISLKQVNDQKQLQIKGMGGEITLNAHTDQNQISHITGQVRHINPGEYRREWPGDLNFDFLMDESLAETVNKFSMHINHINGNLRQYPISGNIDFSYESGKAILHPTKLVSGTSMLEASGTYDGNWNFNWKVHIPTLEMILPHSKGLLTSKGKILGHNLQPNLDAEILAKDIEWQDLKIKSMRATVNTTLEARQNDIDININQFAYQEMVVPIVKVRGQIKFNTKDLSSTFTAHFNSNDYLSAKIKVSDLFLKRKSSPGVDGVIDIHFANVKNLLSSPYINDMRGQLNGHFNLNGKIDHPLLAGKAVLSNAHAKINSLGIVLTGIKLTADYQNQNLILEGKFISGKGTGQITGKVDLLKEHYPLEAHLIGNNLTVMDTTEYQITANPDLSFRYDEKFAAVKGSVFVPYAKINVNDDNNITHLPSEVVFVNKENKPVKAARPLNLDMDLTVKLGDQIHIAYENLKTKLKGELSIKQHPGSLPIASGELFTVNGRYNAYNNLLKITSGRLVYAGNALSDPALDIRAEKSINKVALQTGESQFNDTASLGAVYSGTETLTVGVNVKGTLSKPYLSLFSEPESMSQSDILSYLVFGYPRSEIKNTSTLQMLSQLATSINTNQKNNPFDVTKKIKNSLGLSELGFGSTEFFDTKTGNINNATTVNIGKKFGEKLSVHYSVGIFDSLSILNLKYQLSKRLAIQTETSTMDNGADIFYEFERD